MTEKEILAQIEKMNEQRDHSYSEIMDFIENLPDAEKTPLVLCELARAYNNVAVCEDTDEIDTKLLKAAVAVLESIENEFPENDHLLNYRMGYALFYLDRAGEALERFKKALIGKPNDEDTEYFINWCTDKLAMPIYNKNFAQRIKDGWENFAAGESELRRLISEKADSDDITDLCSELLSDTFTNVCFEVGFNGEKYDLILSPEKDKLMLYLFAEFKKRAPESVTEHWNILLGRQPAGENFELGFHGKKLSRSDITVRIERNDDGCKVVGHGEQLAKVLAEDENEAFWIFDLLLDMTLGEIVNMRYVDTIDLEPEPFEGISLLKLPEKIKELFGKNEDWDSAESFLESGIGYEMKPREFTEDEYPTPRLDAFFGFACIPSFVNGYLNGNYEAFNKADNDGVAAGFIFFPVHVFEDDETSKRGEKILDFRDELERYITEKAGESCVFIGGASGYDNCYLDFLAWDLKPVLDAAAEFFANQNTVPWAYYQSFREDVGVLALMESSEQDE